jgi:hypothetical protein
LLRNVVRYLRYATGRPGLDTALLAAEPAETVTELVRQIATARSWWQPDTAASCSRCCEPSRTWRPRTERNTSADVGRQLVDAFVYTFADRCP